MSDSSTRAVLSLISVGGFFGILAFVLLYGVPEGVSENLLFFLLGGLLTLVAQVGQYYLGSSAGSKTKEMSLSHVVDQQTQAMITPGPPPSTHAAPARPNPDPLRTERSPTPLERREA